MRWGCFTNYLKMNQYHKQLQDSEMKWLGIDLDKTLAEGIWPEAGIGEPMEGAKQAMDELHRLGLKAIIYTARPWSDYENIERWLNDHEMPFSRIVCGKALLLAMIDDRNIEFKGDWNEVVEKVKQL